MNNQDRKGITQKLSFLVAKRLRSKTPYWADEVLTRAVPSQNMANRVDFMAYYPDWKTKSGAMVANRGAFEFYEVKSSMKDFKSGNGLNLEGDYNYLVCPKELAQKLYENQELPNYCTVLCPDSKYQRLIKTYDTRWGGYFNTRQCTTEELLLCLLMRIRHRNEYKEN